MFMRELFFLDGITMYNLHAFGNLIIEKLFWEKYERRMQPIIMEVSHPLQGHRPIDGRFHELIRLPELLILR